MNVPVVRVVNYDPCVEGLGEKSKCDFVACIDVLEHIEPEYLDDVLDDIKAHMGRCGFLTVHTEPAFKHLADGRNAHLIQRPYDWWMEQIRSRFWVSEMVNLGSDVFFTVALNRDGAVYANPIVRNQYMLGKPEYQRL